MRVRRREQRRAPRRARARLPPGARRSTELEGRAEHAARAGEKQGAGEQGLGALRRDAERARCLRGRTAGENLDGPLEIVCVEAAADDLRQRAGAAAHRERERRPRRAHARERAATASAAPRSERPTADRRRDGRA